MDLIIELTVTVVGPSLNVFASSKKTLLPFEEEDEVSPQTAKVQATRTTTNPKEQRKENQGNRKSGKIRERK